MSIRKNQILRKWILGTAATSLLWNTFPSTSSAQGPLFPKKKTVAKPNAARPKPQQAAQGQPDQSATAPRLLNQAGQPVDVTGAPIQQVSNNFGAPGEKSEVQRKLEELYEQNGREMPDINLSNLQPTPAAQLQAGQQFGQQVPQQYAQQPQQPQQPAQQQFQPRLQQNPTPAPRGARPYQANNQQPQNQYQYAPVQAQQSPAQAKPRQASLLGYFKKMTNRSDRNLPTQAPIPPDMPAESVAAIPSAQPAASPFAQQAANTYTQPATIPSAQPSGYATVQQMPQAPPTQFANARNDVSPSGHASISSSRNANPGQSAMPTQALSGITAETLIPPGPTGGELPPLAQEAVPIHRLVAADSSLPELQAEAKQLTSADESSPQSEPGRATVSTESTDSTEAIAESSEPAQDFRTAGPVKRPSVVPKRSGSQAQSNDTVVISPRAKAIEQAEEVAPIPTAEAQDEPGDAEPNPIASSDSDESPYTGEGKDLSEPIEAADRREPGIIDPTAPSLEGVPAKELAPAESAPAIVSKEPAPIIGKEPAALDKREFVPPAASKRDAEKMQKIHERMGMKGLKGFCPVTLRDERELVDAKSEISFVYRSQKFHFATAEARDTFAADPSRYAPAAYGADVVALSRDKDVVEGTLDFAAWYKGKLYLFGTQENYQAFIDNPIPFATLEGIE